MEYVVTHTNGSPTFTTCGPRWMLLRLRNGGLRSPPRKSVLGTVLVLAYNNDLPEYLINGSSANLFVDDSILYGPISNTDDARKL